MVRSRHLPFQPASVAGPARLSDLWRLLLAIAAASVGGCQAGPDFAAPPRPTEQGYLAHPIDSLGSPGYGEREQRLAPSARLRPDWWTMLGSPELDDTVALALRNNQTVEIAKRTMATAAEQVAVARADLYPHLDASTGISRRAYGASFLGPLAFSFPAFSAYTGGLSATYDADVFGGTRRRIELSQADAEMGRDQLDAARLTVAATTVTTALQIAAVRAEIGVIQGIVGSDNQNLQLVREANAAGVATRIDVSSAESQLDSDRALLPPLSQQLDVARDALATLVGRSPADWSPPDFDLDRMELPGEVPLVVPSELVRARPDIRAAEAQLHAASARIGIATADLYPRLQLTAAVAGEGLVSGPAGAAWSLIGGLSAPLFHGGALAANLRGARDAYEASFAQYQQTVLEAFRQIADSLHGLVNAADTVRTEREAVGSATTALALNRLGYGVGNSGIIQVLDAQRLQQLAELNLVQARTQRLLQTVALFTAAGGGIDDAENRRVASIRKPAA